MSVAYTDPAMVNSVVFDLYPPLVNTTTGYGSKLPTSYRVRYGSRWHRVYAIQWENAGSIYIRKGGADLFIDIDTEYALSDGIPSERLGL